MGLIVEEPLQLPLRLQDGTGPWGNYSFLVDARGRRIASTTKDTTYKNMAELVVLVNDLYDYHLKREGKPFE